MLWFPPFCNFKFIIKFIIFKLVVVGKTLRKRSSNLSCWNQQVTFFKIIKLYTSICINIRYSSIIRQLLDLYLETCRLVYIVSLRVAVLLPEEAIGGRRESNFLKNLVFYVFRKLNIYFFVRIYHKNKFFLGTAPFKTFKIGTSFFFVTFLFFFSFRNWKINPLCES